MLSRSVLLQAALAALATSQETVFQRVIASGPYGAASGGVVSSDDTLQQRFAQANQNPNVTKSYKFTPFYVGGVNNGGVTSPDESNVWTLRLNVSDFSVPNAREAFPDEQGGFVDPHISNTVFELEWGTDESFRSALNGSTSPACIAITTASFLPNVTNLITDDNNDGDCGPVLGQDCVQALYASATNLNSCNFGFWESLPECASTIGASRSYAQYGLERISTNLNSNLSATNASYEDVGYAAVANGTDGRYGFESISTDAYNGTNTTIYDMEATRMYVMLLQISPADGTSGLWTQNALCMRANTTKLPVKNGNGGDGSGGGDGSSGSPTPSDNLAPTMMPAAGKVVGVFAGIGLGMYALI